MKKCQIIMTKSGLAGKSHLNSWWENENFYVSCPSEPIILLIGTIWMVEEVEKGKTKNSSQKIDISFLKLESLNFCAKYFSRPSQIWIQELIIFCIFRVSGAPESKSTVMRSDF